MRTTIWAALAFSILVGPLRGADTYHVSTDGNDDLDGLSWGTAVATLSNAVARTVDGDTVVVSNGTYALSEAVLVDRAITVHGVFGSAATIIDGQHAVRGFVVSNAAAVVDGFTVRHGRAGTNHHARQLGGGALVYAGTVRNSLFRENVARDGSGLYFMGVNAVVSNCTFLANSNDIAFGIGFGGGLANLYHPGGVVANCTVVSNVAYSGGMYVKDALLENNVVAYNTCRGNYSGGIRQEGGTNRNSLIFLNVATDAGGGGLFVSHEGALVENATVAYNTAGSAGTDAVNRSSGLRANQDGHPVIRNTIVWGNTFMAGAQEVRLADAAQMSFSCQTNYTGNGNIADNPQFYFGRAGVLALKPASPCIDAGTNQVWMTTTLTEDAAGNPRVRDEVVDMGALEFEPAATYYVSVDGADEGHDGRSWEQAFATLGQAASVARTPGDLILVSNGVYLLDAPVVLTLPVTLRGVFGREATVVDGGDAVRGFVLANGAVLDGVTVRNGLADVQAGFGGRAAGGGALMHSSHALNCAFLDNRAQDGAGVYFYGQSLISNCVFQGNSSTNGYGGGLANARLGGGHSGGVVSHCTVVSNTAQAAGMWVRDALVQNCVVAYNLDLSNFTGGIRQQGGTNRNSLIYRNVAEATGAGMFLSEGALVENATIAYNTAGNVGNDAINRSSGLRANDFNDTSRVLNSIIRHNTFMLGSQEVQLERADQIAFSCQTNFTGNGNIADDPQFYFGPGGVLALKPASPCIDAGTNRVWMTTTLTEDTAGNPRVRDDVVDMGALEFKPAATYYVSLDGADDGHDGLSWEQAFATLGQAASTARTPGDTILVSNGVYLLDATVALTIPVTLRGVFGREATVVDGGEAVRGFLLANGAVMDGVTVRNGLADVQAGFAGRAVGGGALLDSGQALNCAFLDNRAQDGAGVYFFGQSLVSNCVFQGNISTNGYGGGLANASLGGGHSGGVVSHCTVVSNSAQAAGMWVRDALVQSCVVAYNHDPGNFAGGIRQQGGTNRNSLVYRNVVTGASGGGLYVSNHGRVENLTIACNSAGDTGIDPLIRSSGLRANDASDTTIIMNTVVWSNTFALGSSEALLWSSSDQVSYSCMPGAFGVGVVNADPRFRDPALDDFRVMRFSPCINAGTNLTWMATELTQDVAGLPRIVQARVDIGAHERAVDVPVGLMLIIH